MRVLVINPNSSRLVTERLRQELGKVKRPDTELEVAQVDEAPKAINSSYDEAFAVAPLVRAVEKAVRKGVDAIVLACFCDVGVEAAREIASVPVIAMEEATLALALTLGNRFGIITELKPRVAMKELHVRRAGLLDRLASIRPTGLSVSELAERTEEVKRRILALARSMVEEDGAEVIILGCAAMTGYKREIESQLDVPVLDPAPVALKWAEMLVDLGLKHSKVGLYHFPLGYQSQ